MVESVKYYFVTIYTLPYLDKFNSEILEITWHTTLIIWLHDLGCFIISVVYFTFFTISHEGIIIWTVPN